MLRLPPFDWRPVQTLSEAVAILATAGSSARLVAGGTDLWPNLKRGHQQAKTIVSLLGIPELRGVQSNGELRIGATTLLSEITAHREIQARFPALVAAVASISSPPLRNMGTLGGNLCLDTRCTYYNQTEPWRQSIHYCMKEAGQVCWVAPSSPRCWAHSASDSAPILAALDARVRLISSAGERVIPVTELFQDDGIRYLSKQPDEILSDVLVPAEADPTHCRTAFCKLRRRGSIDFAVLSVAVALWLDAGGGVARARIYLGAVGSSPLPAAEAAQALLGRPLDRETIDQASKLARKVATPMDNTDFQAQWRSKMVEVYTAAALRQAAGLEPPGRS